jgi:hypothetical protein
VKPKTPRQRKASKPGKHPGGRPKGSGIKLTPETQERIVLLIRAGNYPEIACEASGISRRVFYNWKERGETGEEPYASFLHSLIKAEAESETTLTMKVYRAGDSIWQAAMTLLERRHPERWGRRERQQIEHSGPGGGPIIVAPGKLAAGAFNGEDPKES